MGGHWSPVPFNGEIPTPLNNGPGMAMRFGVYATEFRFIRRTDGQKNGAVSKCELQGNSPLQKLDKAVKIQFLSDFHGFIVGLIFRKFYFETAPKF